MDSFNVAASLQWFAVHTKPREEGRAARLLGLKGITTFLPRLLVSHRHGSRRWQAAEPLFPGYLFARFLSDAQVLSVVRWTPGVKYVLGDGRSPAPVPEDVVAYLQARAGESGVIVPQMRFRPGMRVRIRAGPLEFLEGIIDRPVPGRQRVRVLLELLRTVVSVEVDVDDLEEV
ncbi:MAG: transcription termination/antitermination NusG family protein [Armatimonadota bacterium]|nr:transcription termination/antitermination NusG family protein [Armatimonadota bacterium]MDR7452029.1 transcription termination/antitermination NusG family protein [Armatimonadota bacterium]MDR7467920.1 transcription termination/antitermination NusG family protein [Armatimonadota bacterium]MDR7494227.1 transcription termination/antitermination NusG family protein [Armatimonadota bacterium]MDR7547831.1 transcription termination/antitermination NusG family protein [Armatimonadota bacterium]